MDQKEIKLMFGIIIPNALAIVIISSMSFTMSNNHNIVWMGIISLPVLMGMISQYYWRGLTLNKYDYIKYHLLNLAVAFFWSWLLIGRKL